MLLGSLFCMKGIIFYTDFNMGVNGEQLQAKNKVQLSYETDFSKVKTFLHNGFEDVVIY